MPNLKFNSAPKIKLDAKKFLGNINKKSFAGQISLVENKLSRLAKEMNTDFRLVSHFGNQIYFEDVNSNCYYQADLNKAKNSRAFVIDNVAQIVIEDKEKGKVFDSACFNLIESLESSLEDGDISKSESILEKIIKGHCTPKVIPESGIVNTWDGGRHKIDIKKSIVSEDIYPQVVDVLKEAVKSSEVTIKEGKITIGEEKAELPISETTRRLAIARNMRTVAEGAYKSDNFNRLMKTVAGHISNNNNRDVVSIFKTFLTEEQEFTMLDKKGIYTLVENSLYGQGIFNYHIVRNTALMMWETNCHLNKKDIVEQWSKAASTCGNKQLCENVEILKESSKKAPNVFSDSFDVFLGTIFNEDSSSRTIKAKAYLNMLKMLNNVVSGSDADAAVKSSVDDLVMRLESDTNHVDDATLFEVEDLLATVSTDLIHDTSTLADFDTIPEPMAADSFATDDEIGDFEGDMGDDLGDDLGGDLGGGFDAEAEAAIDDAELAGEGGEEEVEDEELQLADVMRNAKPVNEMSADDIKVVLEAIKNVKPDVVKVDGEFKKMLKKGLTESEASFVRNVMSHSKNVDQDLFEGITSAYYDLVISEDSKEEKSDVYAFEGNGDIDVNDDYIGIKEEEEKDDDLKGGKSEAGLEGAEEDGLEATQESKEVKSENKGNGSKECDDKDGDYDNNDTKDDDTVEEGKSVAIIGDDEALMDIIASALGDDEAPKDLDGDDGEVISGDDEENDDVISDEEKEGDDLNLSPESDPDGDGNPIWKDEDDQAMENKESEKDAVSEDNNITEPNKNDYDSEDAADKNGDGDKINPKPTFSETDYDGTKGAKTGKQKPSSGHPSA